MFCLAPCSWSAQGQFACPACDPFCCSSCFPFVSCLATCSNYRFFPYFCKVLTHGPCLLACCFASHFLSCACLRLAFFVACFQFLLALFLPLPRSSEVLESCNRRGCPSTTLLELIWASRRATFGVLLGLRMGGPAQNFRFQRATGLRLPRHLPFIASKTRFWLSERVLPASFWSFSMRI